MNRSVLIVICDFLLLMLISSARLDELPSLDRTSTQQSTLQVQDYAAPRTAPAPAGTPDPAASPRTADLLDAMKSSLEEERSSRENLSAMLTRTEQALRSQQQIAAERARELAAAEQTLRAKEEEARNLEQSRQALAGQFAEAQTNIARFQQQLSQTAEQAKLAEQRAEEIQTQYATAQQNLTQLEKELSSTSTEARLARERLAQIDAERQARQAEAEAARKRIEEVERLRLTAEVERERIAGQLKVAETQKEMTQQQLQEAKTQIQTVQEEKQQLAKVAGDLAEGVTTFSEKQEALTQEIRENRPLSANTIYAEFVTNRIDADFRANRPGLLGRTISKNTGARSILVTDGTQTFSIYHVSDTPFKFEDFSKEWERFIVHLYRGVQILPVPQMMFLSIDPRVVVAPVSEAQARQLGVKVYKTVTDPFKFQDALIVGADEGYYGECRFTLDGQNPGYLKMDRNMLGRLVGRFNPRHGDLVFAKSGELIGMMVNDKYCALLSSFVPQATIPTGANLNGDAIAGRLSQMQAHLRQLPQDLQ